jgi:hypothetical protein
MADITLTIPLPVLASGQYFKTRYRALPAGAWSSYVNRTNAPFTLTGLSTGDYQLEVILVKADASECEPTYTGFKVENDFSCIDFSATLVQVNSLYLLRLAYTLPGGFTNPPCGWDIIITTPTSMQTIPYAVLPPTGPIKIAVSNVVMHVKVRANLCDGSYKYCFDDDVAALVPSCTPMVITKSELVKFGNDYYVRIFLYNSSPITPLLTFNYKEISFFYPPNTSPQSGVFSHPGVGAIPGSPHMYSIKVEPRAYPGEGLQYEGTIADVCGKSHYFKTNVLY